MTERAVVVGPGEGHRVGNVEFLARSAHTPRFNLAVITIQPRRAGPNDRHLSSHEILPAPALPAATRKQVAMATNKRKAPRAGLRGRRRSADRDDVDGHADLLRAGADDPDGDVDAFQPGVVEVHGVGCG